MSIKKSIKNLRGKLENPELNDIEKRRIERRIKFLQNKRKNNKAASNNTILPKNTKIDNVSQGVEAEKKVEEVEAETNIKYQNPNISGPTGSQNVTINDDGTVDVDRNLSDNQQAILTGGEQLTQTGQGIAQNRIGNYGSDFNPNVATRTMTGDMSANRQRIEDAAFQKLMGRNEEVFKAQERQLRQTLYNQGVSLDQMDRDPRMQALRERMANTRENASLSAIGIGGQEMQRDFQIQEDLIGNQINQAGTIRNQNLNELGYVSSLGSGLQMPAFETYKGPNFQLSSPVDVNTAIESLKQGDRGLNIDQQRVNQANRPIQIGGGIAQQPNDFVNAPPPGLA